MCWGKGVKGNLQRARSLSEVIYRQTVKFRISRLQDLGGHALNTDKQLSLVCLTFTTIKGPVDRSLKSPTYVGLALTRSKGTREWTNKHLST